MGLRRKGREAALQMLYQIDIAKVDAEQALRLYWASLSSSIEGEEFANAIVRGYGVHRERIDDEIQAVSRHWRLERMSCVDRNILRLGAYELIFLEEVPRRVVLNEAVELAKSYGSEQSPSFVNGVLDQIATRLRKE